MYWQIFYLRPPFLPFGAFPFGGTGVGAAVGAAALTGVFVGTSGLCQVLVRVSNEWNELLKSRSLVSTAHLLFLLLVGGSLCLWKPALRIRSHVGVVVLGQSLLLLLLVGVVLFLVHNLGITA